MHAYTEHTSTCSVFIVVRFKIQDNFKDQNPKSKKEGSILNKAQYLKPWQFLKVRKVIRARDGFYLPMA